MSDDPIFTGILLDLLQEISVDDLQCRGEEILMLGLKQSFTNLAVPESEQGPMDRPTMGIALLCGPKADVSPGMLCYFTKFAESEIVIANRRFFAVKAADIKITRQITQEESNNLARNSY